MKKIFYYMLALKVALVSLFGVIAFFVFDDMLSSLVSNGLNLHVNPCFVGGTVAGDFYGDVHPDLMRYTVHSPVYQAVWQKSAEYWQLDLEFKSGTGECEGNRNVTIYVDADNIGGGNSLLDASHPWDFAICIGNGTGQVFDSNGQRICGVEYYERNGGLSVKVRVPLQDKRLQRLYSAKKTWHYVFMGNEQMQGLKACPVEVDMEHLAASDKKEKEDFCAMVMEKYNGSKEPGNDSGLVFGHETLEQALSFFEEQVERDRLSGKEDAVNLSDYGTCLSMKGGKSSVMQAVRLVNKSFVYLDKSVGLAEENPSLYGEKAMDIYLNRAEVCASVPQSVFGKAETGARDFCRAASLYKSFLGTQEMDKSQRLCLAYLYVRASKCFDTAKNETESMMCYEQAKKILYTE